MGITFLCEMPFGKAIHPHLIQESFSVARYIKSVLFNKRQDITKVTQQQYINSPVQY